MKPLTTLAGTLFLFWFLFSPVVAIYTYLNLFGDSVPVYFFLVYLALIYLLFGFLSYRIAKSFGGIFKKVEEPTYLDSQVVSTSPWYAGLIYLLALSPALFSKYIIGAAATAPVLSGVAGVLIFAAVGIANWHVPTRKRVNFWLTQQPNERVAYAQAEPTLYALNGFLVFLSGMLVVICSLYLFP